MSDGWGYATSMTGSRNPSYDDFVDERCNNCDYYFDVEDGDCDDMTDNNNNPIYSCRVESQCPCHSIGLSEVRFPCLGGYDEPSEYDDDDEETEFRLPAMVFSIHIDRKKLQPIRYSPINAEIQVVDAVARTVSYTLRAGNVYDDLRVCWGNDNSIPLSLPEAISSYASSPGNDDLLPTHRFLQNACESREIDDTSFKPIKDPFIFGPGYDAVLIATAAYTPEAFLLLAGSGASHCNGLLMLGLKRYQHCDGETVNGYITDPIDGHSWLLIDHPDVIEECGEDYDAKALLLGQIQPLTPTDS
jgi:hypothetical protein